MRAGHHGKAAGRGRELKRPFRLGLPFSARRKPDPHTCERATPNMSHGAPAKVGDSPGFLKAKFQIGSINGKQNYKGAERVFHPDDMPKPAKAARNQVKHLGVLFSLRLREIY
jgi:hypothetical protein